MAVLWVHLMAYCWAAMMAVTMVVQRVYFVAEQRVGN
jgi:hypothetical protein